MRIGIFGMGYVGCVSAACLAKAGHHVIGLDVNNSKLELISQGKSPIVEPGIDELLKQQVEEGRFVVSQDVVSCVQNTDVSMICVGTPSSANGSLDLTYVVNVVSEIGAAIKDMDDFHTVLIRSTMLPGSIKEIIIPALEDASQKKHGTSYAVSINPEFLRESTAIKDFHSPPFTLVGVEDDRSSKVLNEIYKDIDAPYLVTEIAEAEMVKYTCNCFHALKVSFANEVGNICKRSNIDSHVVMDVFCKDNKLNLSPYYLKPGFAFGGSCLPKDLRALNYKARQADLSTPVLSAVLESNELQIDEAFNRILNSGSKNVTMLGLSFKSGTDDLRESPMVVLAERLIGKGYNLTIYDKEVEMSRLVGANKSFIESEIPHLSAVLVTSLDNAITESDTIVVCKSDAQYVEALKNHAANKVVVDLVRPKGIDEAIEGYTGLCW